MLYEMLNETRLEWGLPSYYPLVPPWGGIESGSGHIYTQLSVINVAASTILHYRVGWLLEFYILATYQGGETAQLFTALGW